MLQDLEARQSESQAAFADYHPPRQSRGVLWLLVIISIVVILLLWLWFSQVKDHSTVTATTEQSLAKANRLVAKPMETTASGSKAVNKPKVHPVAQTNPGELSGVILPQPGLSSEQTSPSQSTLQVDAVAGTSDKASPLASALVKQGAVSYTHLTLPTN